MKNIRSTTSSRTAGLVDIPTNYYAGQFVLGKEHMSPRGWEGANLEILHSWGQQKSEAR